MGTTVIISASGKPFKEGQIVLINEECAGIFTCKSEDDFALKKVKQKDLKVFKAQVEDFGLFENDEGTKEFVNIVIEGDDEPLVALGKEGISSLKIIKEPVSEATREKEQEMRAAAAKKKKDEPEFKLQEKVQIFPGYDTDLITATDGSRIDVDYKTGT